MKNDELLHKWVQNTLTAEEMRIFQERPEYASLVALHKRTEGLTAPEWDADKMLNTILASPKATNPPPASPVKTRVLPRLFPYVVAASLLLLVGFFSRSFLFDTGSKIELATLSGEVQQGSFPDGSNFKLKENSQISYAEDKWPNQRDVSLEGEAYFSVEKGVSSFRVYTPYGKVQVLGTEFNVQSTNSALTVQCDEGRVRVTAENFNEELEAGEHMWSSAGSSKTYKNNITKLRRVTLKEVTEALTEQYAVTWQTDATDLSTIITCNFKHDNLKLALKTCLSTLDLDYELQGTLVSLSL